jgi:branched-chain amino acid transport system substrate-binding protein
MMKISRPFVSGVAGIGLSSAATPHPVRAADGPIRIGLLTVKTGALASGGIDMERALVMYLKERDYAMAGRKVELMVGDTAGVPATARSKTQEMVEKNDVHCLIGPLAANEALAIADYIRQNKIPTLSVAAAEAFLANPVYSRDFLPAKYLER